MCFSCFLCVWPGLHGEVLVQSCFILARQLWVRAGVEALALSSTAAKRDFLTRFDAFFRGEWLQLVSVSGALPDESQTGPAEEAPPRSRDPLCQTMTLPGKPSALSN